MSRHLTLRDTFVENRLFINRVVAALVLMALAAAGLAARLIYLQVMGHEHYASLSRDNHVKISPLPPTRGLIYDRNGELLAENVPVYSLEIVPEQVSDLTRTLQELQALLELSDEEISRFHALRRRNKSFESVPLRFKLNDEELARFAVRLPDFPGVSIQGRLVRRYPYGRYTAHLIGYVGRITEEDNKTLDPAAYRGALHIGKAGVEKTYETALRGRTGYEEIETNVQGRPIQRIGVTPPQSGADLYLSLDIQLQKTAYEALGEHSGALVALDNATGKVLAMVSKPGFDPNPFVTGIDDASYNALQNDGTQPLYHRAIRGHYPPGSTLKPFMGLAGLESGEITANHHLYCPGYYQLPNVDHRYRDWKKYGHGSVDLAAAITESCDVYFYDLAYHLGIDRMHAFLGRFGFGEKSGIDIAGETAGLLPSRDWKRQNRNQPWFLGETLIAGVGQGYVLATPLQLARATAILANRGRIVTPRLVERLETTGGAPLADPFPLAPAGEIFLQDASWNAVTNAMIEVVHGTRGTAKGINKQLDYRIAGKTGTAQVFTIKQNEEYRESRVEEELKDHAWFIAYAPADAPRIAVAVIAEHGGHGGSVAAPIARQVIDHYLSGRPCPAPVTESGACPPPEAEETNAPVKAHRKTP
jgi:penicillin-binding protein 2